MKDNAGRDPMQARLQRRRLELEPHSISLDARADALNGDQIGRAKSSELQKGVDLTPTQEEGEISQSIGMFRKETSNAGSSIARII